MFVLEDKCVCLWVIHEFVYFCVVAHQCCSSMCVLVSGCMVVYGCICGCLFTNVCGCLFVRWCVGAWPVCVSLFVRWCVACVCVCVCVCSFVRGCVAPVCSLSNFSVCS